jgi:hypothetical protein
MNNSSRYAEGQRHDRQDADFHAEILIEQLIDLLCKDWALIIGPWFRRFPALM